MSKQETSQEISAKTQKKTTKQRAVRSTPATPAKPDKQKPGEVKPDFKAGKDL